MLNDGLTRSIVGLVLTPLDHPHCALDCALITPESGEPGHHFGVLGPFGVHVTLGGGDVRVVGHPLSQANIL
ncbi:MAG: hypothetical protein WD114_05600 [Phycisphaerales bacterium]